jgi:hypothetical protein
MCRDCGCVRNCGECRFHTDHLVVLKTKPAYNCVRFRIIVPASGKPCGEAKPREETQKDDQTKPLF